MRFEWLGKPSGAIRGAGGAEEERRELEAECQRLQLLVGELLQKNEELRSELRGTPVRCLIALSERELGGRVKDAATKKKLAGTLHMAPAQYQGRMLAQMAACNRIHEGEERLSRWLLIPALYPKVIYRVPETAFG